MTLDKNIDLKENRLQAASMYRYTWDCFCEPIQNSMKSITIRMKDDPEFKDGLISIHINRKDRLIRVTDTGVGFNPDEIGLNKSNWKKYKGPEAGYGLGLTALALQSDKITIQSRKTDGNAHKREATDWYKLTLKNNQWKWGKSKRDWKINGDYSTFVEIKSNRQSYQQLWNQIDEWLDDASDKPNDKEKRLYVFNMLHNAIRWLSAIGHTGDLFDYNKKFKSETPKIKYSLKLTHRDGKINEVTEKPVGHPLTGKSKSALDQKSKPSGGWGPNDLICWSSTQTTLYPVPNAFHDNESGEQMSARISYKAFSMADDDASDDIIIRMKKKLPEAIFPLEYKSRERWYLSVNGYPQANVSIARNNAANLQSPANSIAIIDIQLSKGRCLDPGRNVLSSGFNQIATQKISQVASKINKIQTNKAKSDPEPWEIAQVIHDSLNKVKHNSWIYPNVKIPITRTSTNDNDEAWVQHIFSSLITKGKIKEISPIHIGSNQDIYDIIFTSNGPVRALEKAHKKRFGIKLNGGKTLLLDDPKSYKKGFSPLPFVGEFKTSATQLVSDLEGGRTRKTSENIHLLICWDEGDFSKYTEWELEEKDIGKGLFRCANYTLKKNVANFRPIEVIVLESYLDELNSNWNDWPESCL